MSRIAAAGKKALSARAERHSIRRPDSEFAEHGVLEHTFDMRTMRIVLDSSPWVNSAPRRCLDCFAAAIALAVLSPVMAICAILIHLSSPGSILFKQRRLGRNGIEFDFYKFRSMAKEDFPNASTHTVQGDCRITRVGAFLRRYKLDELPQFWNVLKGDMSLVGPRPKLPQHEGLFLTCRPGITGEATLTFRNEEQMLVGIPSYEVDAFYECFFKPVKAALDISYMRSASLKSDLRLLLRTAGRCLSPQADPIEDIMKLLSSRINGTRAADASHGTRTNHNSKHTRDTSDPAAAPAD